MVDQNTKASRAGGAIIAATTLVGALAGAWLGQPSLGVVAGFGTGAIIALLLYLRDRKR